MRRIHRPVLLSAVPFTGLFDNWTANLFSAVSVAQLFTADPIYPIVAYDTVSLGTLTTQYTRKGLLDSTKLLSDSNGHDLTTSSLECHPSGGTRGFGMAATSYRAALVTSGAYLGGPQFNGTSNGAGTSATSGTPSGVTIYMRGKLRSTAGTQILLELSANFNNNNAWVVYYDATTGLNLGAHRLSPTGYAVSQFSGAAPNDDVHCYRFDLTALTSAAMCTLAIDGVAQTRTADASSGTLPGGNFASNTYYLAARAQASLFASLNLHTLFIFEALHTDAQVAAFSPLVKGLPSA